jgi:hypothetical protein
MSERRVIDEGWRAVSAKETGNMNELHHGPGQHGCLPWGYDDEDMASCRLASAAPDMARVLLRAVDAGLLPGRLEDEAVAALKKAGVR